MSRVRRLFRVLLLMAVCAIAGGMGIARAQSYTLSIAPSNISIQQGWWASIDVTEKTTTTSAPPLLTLQVTSSNSEGVTFSQSTVFTSGTTIVYQLNAAVPISASSGTTAGPFVVWDSSHTVSTSSFTVSVLPYIAPWSVVPAPNNINSWIALPTIDFPGVGSIKGDTTFSIATSPNSWQPLKWTRVPTLGNNAPVIVFDLQSPVPCSPLIQVLRNGSVISSSGASEYSTQWTYRTYLPNCQPGDIIQLYALSQSSSTTTNHYYDFYY